MLASRSKTNAGFVALLAAVDAEIEELLAAGQHRFHDEAEPRSARLLMQAAVQRQQLRGEIVRLHAKWTEAFGPPGPLPAVDPRGALEIKVKSIAHAMTHNEAAKRLGVTPLKVRTWLETGLLKGQQLTRTKWQIDAQDVLTFAREHAKLL